MIMDALNATGGPLSRMTRLPDPAQQSAQDPLAALRAQLIAQAPNADWNASGVDRASELANILNSRGITDLSKLSVGAYQGAAPDINNYYGRDTGGDNGHTMSYAEAQEAYQADLDNYNKMKVLKYGDQTLGGDLTDTIFTDYMQDPSQLAWSAAGHGNVSYRMTQDPTTGKTVITPNWGSSSDWGIARDLGKKALVGAGLVAGAGALGADVFGGLGGAGTAAGGAEAGGALGSLSPDLIASGGVYNGAPLAMSGAVPTDIMSMAGLPEIGGAVGSGALAGVGGAAGSAAAGEAFRAPSLAGINSGNAAAAAPGFLDKLGTNLGNAAGNWWDKFTNLDPTAWQQALGGVGALNSLINGSKNGSGAVPFPTLPGGTGFGAQNDWTAAQQPGVRAFLDRPATPTQWTPRAHYAEGGDVEQGEPTMGDEPEQFDSSQQSYVEGDGAGQDDTVQAALSPGEFVWDADVVAAIGDGSNEEGAKRLDEVRRMIRERNRSAPPDQIPPKALPLEGYLQQVTGN